MKSFAGQTRLDGGLEKKCLGGYLACWAKHHLAPILETHSVLRMCVNTVLELNTNNGRCKKNLSLVRRYQNAKRCDNGSVATGGGTVVGEEVALGHAADVELVEELALVILWEGRGGVEMLRSSMRRHGGRTRILRLTAPSCRRCLTPPPLLSFCKKKTPRGMYMKRGTVGGRRGIYFSFVKNFFPPSDLPLCHRKISSGPTKRNRDGGGGWK